MIGSSPTSADSPTVVGTGARTKVLAVFWRLSSPRSASRRRIDSFRNIRMAISMLPLIILSNVALLISINSASSTASAQWVRGRPSRIDISPKKSPFSITPRSRTLLLDFAEQAYGSGLHDEHRGSRVALVEYLVARMKTNHKILKRILGHEDPFVVT